MDIDIEKLSEKAVELALEYGPKLILAIIVLIVGLRLIKIVQKLIKKAANKSNLDDGLRTFLTSLAGWFLKIILFIAVAEMVGVETTSLIAVLGAAGLAVGLALQGTLANFAGGVLILLFKPYRVGDLIESQGQLGVVKSIQIVNTIILSPENKTIILPNGAVMNNHITNYTTEGKIRVDMTVGISYSADMKRAKDVLLEMLEESDKVLKEPAPLVAVSELADSSVNLVVRPWCKPEDYWDVYFDTMENCKRVLDTHEVEIPFPQRDVHVYQH